MISAASALPNMPAARIVNCFHRSRRRARMSSRRSLNTTCATTTRPQLARVEHRPAGSRHKALRFEIKGAAARWRRLEATPRCRTQQCADGWNEPKTTSSCVSSDVFSLRSIFCVNATSNRPKYL
eukprot:CAMPEP_0178999970 /NCGR_PEP_ID=MMETSP0795-20121207/10393_1 /TAXON_ID=88552 /ORGANISM="Amoebophrya sp., Strain Ameob2" /LENGTH=124 /DNA_ID=CAMNT_0020692877 /DNA_START=1493 /DNA_END=1864 /DNA_ORIENTATION=-